MKRNDEDEKITKLMEIAQEAGERLTNLPLPDYDAEDMKRYIAKYKEAVEKCLAGPNLPELNLDDAFEVAKNMLKLLKQHANSRNLHFVMEYFDEIVQFGVMLWKVKSKVDANQCIQSSKIEGQVSVINECDRKCDECKFITDPNWRMGYLILARIVQKHGNVRKIVEGKCKTMTSCPECREAWFKHAKDCTLGKEISHKGTSQNLFDRVCTTDCNHCVAILTENWVLGYLLFARLDLRYKDVYQIVESACPNMTVCPMCRVDDFVHVEGCSIDRLLEQ